MLEEREGREGGRRGRREEGREGGGERGSSCNCSRSKQIII